VSVLFGASFDNVVCLDIDGMHSSSLRAGMIEEQARRIGDRFHLGDCLIILSGFYAKEDRLDWPRLNYHLIYDQKTSWSRVRWIICRLAGEGVLEDKLRSLKLSRGGFTLRMSRKTADGFVPFPVGYVLCDYPSIGKREPGGIVDYLARFRISINCRG
jgi:hypothetical protein